MSSSVIYGVTADDVLRRSSQCQGQQAHEPGKHDDADDDEDVLYVCLPLLLRLLWLQNGTAEFNEEIGGNAASVHCIAADSYSRGYASVPMPKNVTFVHSLQCGIVPSLLCCVRIILFVD